ncbi:hypothetical protein L1049_015306 [Liquidambar formosana]|uniref:C3H1-type domain-containing protein n=1 Tax=Liquidambar formosana TaxID=63359 RepID=A0AAP0WZN4_LIQFO
MEGLYNNSNPRIPKMKANGNVSPINSHIDSQFAIGRGRYVQSKSSSFDSYTPGSLDNMDSTTILRILRSGSPSSRFAPSGGDGFTTPVTDAGKYRPMIVHQYSNSNSNNSGSFGSRVSSSVSPLSAVENLEKVEEDVLVIDGILVGSVPGGRMRSVSDSGGSSSSSSLSGNNLYKTDICRSWEDSGTCRYGSKCQFAHGKEELRPTRFITKNKSEAQMCKSYATTGCCMYGTKCRFVHQVMTAAAAAAAEAEVAASTAHTASPIKPEHASSGTITSGEWSPLDDGIEAVLPYSSTGKPPAREDVDAYICRVLYGPTGRRRLPVFAEIYPE